MWSGGPGLCLTCQTFPALMLIQALGCPAFLLMFSLFYEGHLQLGPDHVVPCTDVSSCFCCHDNRLKQWWSDRLCDTKLRDWTCSGLHTGLDLKVCRCHSPSHCPQTTPPVQACPPHSNLLSWPQTKQTSSCCLWQTLTLRCFLADISDEHSLVSRQATLATSCHWGGVCVFCAHSTGAVVYLFISSLYLWLLVALFPL